MIDDDEQTKPAGDVVLGADLSTFSLEELRERITSLEAEIGRIGRIIEDKTESKSTAEQFFKT